MQIKYSALLLKVVIFGCCLGIYGVSCLHCSPDCTYSYDLNVNRFAPRCSSFNANTCTECDTRFYNLIPQSGQCTKPAQNIYNTTIRMGVGDWSILQGQSEVNSRTYDGDTWKQLRGDAILVQNIYANSTSHYGVQCRISMYITANGASGFNPLIYFKFNNIYTQQLQLVPFANDEYEIPTWIYTTPYFSYKDQFFQIYIERNDDQGNTGNDEYGIKDAICYIAQCVENCLNCSSLSDCSHCSSGYYLDTVTRYCTLTCPAGTFPNSVTKLCQLCDPRCDICQSNAINCTNCADSGPFQSFLEGVACVSTCTAPLIKDYNSHTCICPTENYTMVGSVCTPCITNCSLCNSTTITLCDKCLLGFYLRVSRTQCLSACPIGQYAYLILELGLCYACDLTACTTCTNSSTTCTSCNFATNNRYLSNSACVYLCPDGYEGNNSTFVCDLCPLGLYSYENVCYSQCPQYYLARYDIRACVLPGGYPLNLTIQVQNENTLKFFIRLPLGLNSSILTYLNTSWSSYIKMYFVTETQNKLVLNSLRLLQSYDLSKQMIISNAFITNTSITLYSSTVSASDLVATHSFVVRFADNLLSSRNVQYSLSSKNSTDNNPWMVSELFQLNTKPFYLIGVFLAVLGLIIVLMRTKYIYRIMIEYIQCIQLLGLTFYSIYPHSAQLNLYSFVKGFDYANFSFIINIPAEYITPCYDCKSLVSFSFAAGDMNWIRLMGGLLLCLVIMLIFCLVIYLFKCSRMYAKFYLYLVIDLVLIKTIHGWFASLLYSGLNYNYNSLDNDMYILGVHFLSYLILTPILYKRIQTQYEKKFLNISFICLNLFIILLTLLSLAPTLICALLLLLTAVQWGLINGLNITEQQIPEVRKQQTNNQINSTNSQVLVQPQTKPIALTFNHYLLRSIKPLTAFLVACIIMIQDQIVPIVLVSTIIFVLLILIIIDTYLLYQYHEQLEKKQANQVKPPKSKQIMNETKQDLNLRQKETQYKEINNASQIDRVFKNFDDNDDADDDIVANKFRKNRGSVSVKPYNQDFLIKNLD